MYFCTASASRASSSCVVRSARAEAASITIPKDAARTRPSTVDMILPSRVSLLRSSEIQFIAKELKGALNERQRFPLAAPHPLALGQRTQGDCPVLLAVRQQLSQRRRVGQPEFSGRVRQVER